MSFNKLDKSKTYLITGAAGFIGFFLSKQLLEQGCPVIGIDNMNAYYDVRLKYARLEQLKLYELFTFIKGDISDQEMVSRAFEEYQPNVVVNLAAQAGVRYSIEHPDVYIQSNIVGFFNILEACRHNPVEHLVYASSSSVYGNQQKTPFSVTDKVDQPISLYAASKKSNELMAYTYSHLYGIPATGLRFFTVYGPFGRPDMAYFSFTEKIMAGQPISIYNHGDLYRDFTYIDDIICALEHILPSPPKADETGTRHKVYNIGNNRPERLELLVETLEKCLGKTAKKEYLPMQAGDVYQTYADVTELINDFEFRPDTTLLYGLKVFVEWYREYNRQAD
ncbi:MAG: NAD-dependent epimerase/dehydratase [Oscillospiraceae bacterium]|nr:NAD-dependent epimerase/dehydratase [Oscillospiraceae bacterium]